MKALFEAAALAKALRPLEAHLPRLTESQRSLNTRTHHLPFNAALFIETVAPGLCRLTAFSREDRFVSVYAKCEVAAPGRTSLPWDCVMRLLKSMTHGPHKIPDVQLRLTSNGAAACELRAGRLTMNLIGAGEENMPGLPDYVEGVELAPLDPPAPAIEQLVSKLTSARRTLVNLEPFREVSAQAREKYLRAYVKVRAAKTEVARHDTWRTDWQDARQRKKYALQREERARELMPQPLLPEAVLHSCEALDAALHAEDVAEVATMAALMAESDVVAGKIASLKVELGVFEKACETIDSERAVAERAWFTARNDGDAAAEGAADRLCYELNARREANLVAQGALQTKLNEASRAYEKIEVKLSSARAAQARLQARGEGNG